MHDSKGKVILGGYPARVRGKRIGRLFFDPEGVMILFRDGSIEFGDAEFCRKHVEMIYDATLLLQSDPEGPVNTDPGSP